MSVQSEETKPRKNICVGLLAHVDAGKTTLSEAILYESGSIRKLGRVDNKDAFLDTHALEKERGITIFSKQAVLTWNDTRITLLDTPGHVDFAAEMERTLKVLDYAILVINAADGIQGHTETLWRLLQSYRMPVFLFFNKMDQSGTEKERLMKEVRESFTDGCIDFSTEGTEEFYENVAMCDEHALEQFLQKGSVEDGQIRRLIKERKVFPCFFGAALKMMGVREFLNAIERLMEEPSYPAEFGARVYKISRDDSGNRLIHMKITGGSLKVRSMLGGEKVNQIRIYSGEKFESVPQVSAGQICVVTGLTKAAAGDGFGGEQGQKTSLLEPVLRYRMILPEGYDVAQILPKCRVLMEEEPELHIVWLEEQKELQVQLMGEVQLEILKRIFAERFGVDVSFGTGSIVYKETIAGAVEGVGHFEPLRHYAEVHLLMEPLPPGSGIRIASDCSEDMLSLNWQRLILTHLSEKEHRGVLTGSAITDMKITLKSGRAHLKHTEGGDFRQATYRAVRQGLMQAESILLEPYYEFRLEVPEKMVGRAMTDIEKMSGEFQNPSLSDDRAVLSGTVPVSEIKDYRKEVASYTGGRGRLSLNFLGFMPCHNADVVIEGMRYDPERDTGNPSYSVFCAHGAGFNVSWDKVKEYMHLGSIFDSRAQLTEVKQPIPEKKCVNEAIGVEEIDAILNRAGGANRRDAEHPKKEHWSLRRRETSFTKDGQGKRNEKSAAQNLKIQEEVLLVDGYNVIFAWDDLRALAEENMDGARGRLLDILCDYQAVRKCCVIAVFDAYRIKGHPTETLDYQNIHVVDTKGAETADRYIEKFAHENGRKYHITVATSDGLEQIIIRGQGCTLISARELQKEITSCRQNVMEEFSQNHKEGRHFPMQPLSDEIKKQIGEQSEDSGI